MHMRYGTPAGQTPPQLKSDYVGNTDNPFPLQGNKVIYLSLYNSRLTAYHPPNDLDNQCHSILTLGYNLEMEV